MAFTSIDNPELYFQTKLYTGNGTDDTAITLDGDENMQPDWVWIKERDDTNAHYIFDSVRGIDKQLQSNSNAAEYDYSGDSGRSLKSFNSSRLIANVLFCLLFTFILFTSTYLFINSSLFKL